MRTRTWLLVAAPALILSLALLGEAAADEIGDDTSAPPPRPAVSPGTLRGERAARWRLVLGRSVQGRLIVAERLGDPRSERPTLVVGCIHGNEPAGIAIARDLIADPSPRGESLLVIPVLNPDGVAAMTRQNAHGIDLNRNFPWRWRHLGGVFDSGPHPLSEPESRITQRFILQHRPVISIWFHQHADLVDASGGTVAIERRYARLTHMQLRRLTRYPGSPVGWENHVMPGTTAFVVELRAGRLSPAAVELFSDAILRLI